MNILVLSQMPTLASIVTSLKFDFRKWIFVNDQNTLTFNYLINLFTIKQQIVHLRNPFLYIFIIVRHNQFNQDKLYLITARLSFYFWQSLGWK